MAASKGTGSKTRLVSERPRASRDKRNTGGALDKLFKVPSGQRAITGAVMMQRDRITPGENIRENAKLDIGGFRDGILALRDLGLGIEGTGILQPLIVMPDPDRPGYFVLLFGFRRFWATEFSHAELPVMIVASSEAARVVMQVLENHARKGFNLREEVAAVKRLNADKHSIRDIARLMGEGRHWVENRLNLGKAQPDVQELLNKHLEAPGVTINNLLLIESVLEPKLRAQLVKAATGELSERDLRTRIENAQKPASSVTTGSTPSGQNSPSAPSQNAGGQSGFSGGAGSACALGAETETRSSGDVVLDQLRAGVKGLAEAAAILEGGVSTVIHRRAVEQEIKQAETQLARVQKAARRG